MTIALTSAFVCWFRGEADYEVGGRQYSCRTFAIPGDGPTATSADGWYNADYYFVGILPAVGTIRIDHGDYHAFPPAEVCALFPDFVPARWNADFTALEYLGEKPAVVVTAWRNVWGRALAEKFIQECYPDDDRVKWGLTG